jgi:hypothetical protein
MKKVVAFSVCALLGGVVGYFITPILAMAVAQSSDPAVFAGAMLANYKSSIICDCNTRSSGENAKELAEYLSTLQRYKDADQKSTLLTQEIGLTYLRLSLVETKLDEKSQAEQDMKKGQAELSAIGWKDTSTAHLTSLSTQLDSEYRPVDQNKKTVLTSTTGPL